MSERPDGTRYQANFKSPGGTLLNVYASDATELSHQLEELEGIASQIAALEGVLRAASNAAGISAPPSQQSAGNPPSSPGNGGATPSCIHGQRIYREGVSKAGKPYKMWACPNPDRNTQCKAEWVN